jgi:hypothetical protein
MEMGCLESYSRFDESEEEPERCERCGEALQQERIVWLELNNKTQQWRDGTQPEFPEEESQGCYAFGTVCAKKHMGRKSVKSVLSD